MPNANLYWEDKECYELGRMQQQLQREARLQILDLVRRKEWRQIVSVYCSDNHTKCKKEKQHMVWYSAMWRWNINNLPLLTIWSQILKVPMTCCGRLLGSGLPQVGGYSAILHKITTYTAKNNFILEFPDDEPQCPLQTYIEKSKNVKSWEECSSNCRKSPDCKYWTWFDKKNGGKSYLCIAVTIALSARKKSSTWSGTRECGGEVLIIGLCHLRRLLWNQSRC